MARSACLANLAGSAKALVMRSARKRADLVYSGPSKANGKGAVSGVLYLQVLLNNLCGFGSFGDERGGCRIAVLQFFCKAGFTKPSGFFLTGQSEEIQLLDGTIALEELRLGMGEGNLRLLTRFAECL